MATYASFDNTAQAITFGYPLTVPNLTATGLTTLSNVQVVNGIASLSNLTAGAISATGSATLCNVNLGGGTANLASLSTNTLSAGGAATFNSTIQVSGTSYLNAGAVIGGTANIAIANVASGTLSNVNIYGNTLSMNSISAGTFTGNGAGLTNVAGWSASGSTTSTADTVVINGGDLTIESTNGAMHGLTCPLTLYFGGMSGGTPVTLTNTYTYTLRNGIYMLSLRCDTAAVYYIGFCCVAAGVIAGINAIATAGGCSVSGSGSTFTVSVTSANAPNIYWAICPLFMT